jgi:hypothetical protein
MLQNHKNKRTLTTKEESQNQNNFDSNRRTSEPTNFQKNYNKKLAKA